MPVAAVWRAGSPNLMDAFLYVTAAYLYWRWSSARIPLQILAVVEGSVALYDWYNMRYFIGSWSVLHGDIVAVGAWHAVGLMAIGVLAIIHFTAERLERSPRGAPSAGSTSA